MNDTRTIRKKAAGAIGRRTTTLLLCVLLTVTATVAWAKHGHGRAHSRSTARRGVRPAAPKDYPQPSVLTPQQLALVSQTQADPQMLVNMGKLPPHFDPLNLSKPPILTGKSVVLMDADTGQILWERNADEPRFPASTTKILTGLIFAERTQPTDVITCTDPTVVQIEESSLHIRPWEKFRAKDLLYGLMLRSANDAAVVIAEHLSGSVAKFADRMNERAIQAGATNSHFANPNGLPNPNHYTTARDLALIARAALQNPRFADAVSIPRRVISRSIVAQDVVVQSKAKSFYKYFPGADGVKTGWIRQSGNCFVGSATRDGRRLLSVILGARSNASGETVPLLSWGFRRFRTHLITPKGAKVGEVPIEGGQVGSVSVVTAHNLHISEDSLLPPTNPAPQVRLEPNPHVQAPVQRGQEVGRLVATAEGKVLATVPVVAESEVAPTVLEAAGRQITGVNAPDNVIMRWRWPLAGVMLLLLVGWGYGTVTKSTRRRRNRLAEARREFNSRGARVR